MKPIRLKVVYEPYQRYEPSAPCVGHITANSFREAIIKMLDRVRMYLDPETIQEYEEEQGREMTQEELIRRLEMENGDGCDYIFSLSNEDSGEEYMSVDTPTFEEWYI